jgi:hypothetical protein
VKTNGPRRFPDGNARDRAPILPDAPVQAWPAGANAPWLRSRVRALTAPFKPRSRTKRLAWFLGLAIAVILGAALRLVWPRDIEYKIDEAWTFQQAQAVGRTAPFPWLGMPSSAEIANPGMSLWVFVLLSRLFAVTDPVGLARAVQYLNVAALVLLIWVAFRPILRDQRESWLWAAALAAVNPLAVLFHRKIWPPSVLPLCTLVMLLAWWRRERPWGAFAWGLIGACLGQVHMSGFFFAAGFTAWALLFDRKRVAWRAWLCGSCLGALPLFPWLWYLVTEGGGQAGFSARWIRLLEFKFWFHWATEPLGLGLKYALGEDFSEFLGYPFIQGWPTFLVGLLHVVIAGVGAVIFARAGQRLWRSRKNLGDLWIGRQSATAFTQGAALWGFGILLTLPLLAFNRHYLIITFPLEFIWLAGLALGPAKQRPGGLKVARALLLVLCVSQLLLSASFLSYVHNAQREIQGHYRTPYGAQASNTNGPF